MKIVLQLGITFLSVFLTLGSCNSIVDSCLFQFPDEKTQTDIFEIKSNSDFTSFEVLRKSTYVGQPSSPPFNYELNNFRYSIDGKSAYFLSYFGDNGRKLINYGPEQTNYNIELGPVATLNGTPYPQGNFEIGVSVDFTFKNIGSIDSVIVGFNYVTKRNYVTGIIDTVLNIMPEEVDSTHVTQYKITDSEIDLEGTSWFVIKEYVSEITTNSILFGDQPVLSNEKFQKTIFLKLNKNNTIDTLFTSNQEFSENYNSTIRIIRNKVFLNKQSDVYLIDPITLEQTFLYSGGLPTRMSSNGRFVSLEFNSLIDLEDPHRFELYTSVDNIYEIYPGNSFTAILHSGYQEISIFDHESQQVTNTIALADVTVPEPIDYAESSTLEFRSPYINSNGELVVMAVRLSYLTDPDFKCYD